MNEVKKIFNFCNILNEHAAEKQQDLISTDQYSINTKIVESISTGTTNIVKEVTAKSFIYPSNLQLPSLVCLDLAGDNNKR